MFHSIEIYNSIHSTVILTHRNCIHYLPITTTFRLCPDPHLSSNQSFLILDNKSLLLLHSNTTLDRPSRFRETRPIPCMSMLIRALNLDSSTRKNSNWRNQDMLMLSSLHILTTPLVTSLIRRTVDDSSRFFVIQ